MNVGKLYSKLIRRATTRALSGYVEWHHVVPRALGGLDTPNNLVALTAKEHYMAHLLLWRMLPCVETAAAFMLMSNRLVIRGREYEKAKIEFSKNNPSKTQEGRERLSRQQSGRTLSEETKRRLSVAHAGKPKPKVATALLGKKNPEHAEFMRAQSYAAKPIRGVNAAGETREWPSASAFSREFGIATNTPTEAMRLGRPCKGWKLEKKN